MSVHPGGLMNTLQAIAVALMEGATELFPVSASVTRWLVPQMLHWDPLQRSPAFLPFLVMLHTRHRHTYIIYFWRDWRARGGAGQQPRETTPAWPSC